MRIRFEKGGVLRYVGHLDMMRYFQKAIRRSGIPIAYSKGFHPHQQMSFAMPLGVGVTSEGEYLDIDLLCEADTDSMRLSLENEMADGVHILSVRELSDDEGNAMASVAAAKYYLYLKERGAFSMDELLKYKRLRFDSSLSMPITKKTKKSEREIDLKPYIYDFRLEMIPSDMSDKLKRLIPDYASSEFCVETGDIGIYLFLSAGSEENIKPELFIRYLTGRDTEWEYFPFGIHRLDLLKRSDGGYISL